MGQVQSEEYQFDEPTEDVGDSELNSKESTQSSQEKSQEKQPNDNKLKSKCSKIPNEVTNQQNQRQVRKLSNVSHRNIQLLSMKPHTERDAYADGLRSRRRSSLINLILGAPSSGPRFCDDLCSLNSHMSDLNFGIEFFPEQPYHNSISSLRPGSIEDFTGKGGNFWEKKVQGPGEIESSVLDLKYIQESTEQKIRRSSLSGLAANNFKNQTILGATTKGDGKERSLAPSMLSHQLRKPSLTSTLASIDLTSSFEQHDKSGLNQGNLVSNPIVRPPLFRAKQTIFESVSQESVNDLKTRALKGRVNQTGRVLRRSGSELSLYSTVSAGSAGSKSQRSSIDNSGTGKQQIGKRQSSNGPKLNSLGETKLIIMLQVCLPFILAGFGNMAAGLVLNRVAHWRAFHNIPMFFILLPPFIGMKGNIEMTLASRLSTLANLKLLDTSDQKRRAYISNLILILSQATGLSVFATSITILCELLVGNKGLATNLDELLEISIFVVLSSALLTAMILVIVSSIMMSMAIGLANLIQVNPDNLSTLIAALYGDVSCVLVYGLVADLMFSLHEQKIIIWPAIIICTTLALWPILLYLAYELKETHTIALSSIPPMITSILISIGSGAVLSLVIDRFRLIALYQPVVNGFGANLIAVQASRVSTWLWCSALRRIPIDDRDTVSEDPKKIFGSLASFTAPIIPTNETSKPLKLNPLKVMVKLIKTILWSFCNSSPNSIAAKLLLLMLIPAQTLYFLVIWILSPESSVTLTVNFYFIYVTLCLVQVFFLLTICEPLMTFLMKQHLDPDVFGISILMALADLIGTLCLTGAFYLLAELGDINAHN